MSSFIIELIVALLKAFIPSIGEATKDTYIEADPDKDVENRLRNRVADVWGKALILVCLSFALVGCGTRTVYVPDGTPMKLRETLYGVKVWVKPKDGGEPIATFVDVPEGWYVLPDKK